MRCTKCPYFALKGMTYRSLELSIDHDRVGPWTLNHTNLKSLKSLVAIIVKSWFVCTKQVQTFPPKT